MNLRRPLYGPQDPRGPSRGRDVLAVKRGLNRVEQSLFPRPPGGFDDVYGRKAAQAVEVFQRISDIPATGHFGQATLDALWPYMDAYARLLYRTSRARRALPDLGPVQPGGVSLLDMSLTHDTSGIPLFPAVDTAWGGGGGVVVIAPEGCVVDTKDTSSSPGEAVFLTGVSELRHWIGHLDRDWPLEHEFRKGDLIGKTLPIPGQSDHAHWGVNAEAFLGPGKELKWGATGKGPRYTLGAPTIREQLEKALA